MQTLDPADSYAVRSGAADFRAAGIQKVCCIDYMRLVRGVFDNSGALGKHRREQANRRHLLEGKPSTRTRRLKGTTDVAKADEKRIKRLLGKA